jgi:prophage maintenance system killer protein
VFETAACSSQQLSNRERAPSATCLDGNKRTALVTALVFLDINGVSLERDDERLYELTVAAAEGRVDKAQITAQLRKLVDEADG